jgi:hypothetical protein
MHFRFDPVHSKRDQSHPFIGVKAFHRFHEPDIAFLNQISFGQPVSGVAPSNMYDKTKVGEDQLAGRIDALFVIEPLSELTLALCR